MFVFVLLCRDEVDEVDEVDEEDEVDEAADTFLATSAALLRTILYIFNITFIQYQCHHFDIIKRKFQ